MRPPRFPLLAALVSSGCTFGLEGWGTDTGSPGIDTAAPVDSATPDDSGDSGHDTAIDTGPADDTGPVDDTGHDTGTGSHIPEMLSFQVSDGGGALEVRFQAADADGDLDGGTFELIIDSTLYSYAIPGDLDTWDPEGESSLRVPVEIAACAEQDYSLAGRVVDAAGQRSATLTADASVMGEGTHLAETGDAQDSTTALGTLARDSLLCGVLSPVSNDGLGYTGDYDWVSFQPAESGTWTIELDWTATNADYDFFLLNPAGVQVTAATSASTTAPESGALDLSSGQTYTLVIVGWEGNPGDYSVALR